MRSSLAHSQPFRSSPLWVHARPLNLPNNLYSQCSNNHYGDTKLVRISGIPRSNGPSPQGHRLSVYLCCLIKFKVCLFASNRCSARRSRHDLSGSWAAIAGTVVAGLLSINKNIINVIYQRYVIKTAKVSMFFFSSLSM